MLIASFDKGSYNTSRVREKVELTATAHLHNNTWRRERFKLLTSSLPPKQRRRQSERVIGQIDWAQEKEEIAACFLETRIPVIPTGNIIQEASRLGSQFSIWQVDCTQRRINPRLKMIISTMDFGDLCEAAFKKFQQAKRQEQEISNSDREAKIQADKQIFYWSRVLKVLKAA